MSRNSREWGVIADNPHLKGGTVGNPELTQEQRLAQMRKPEGAKTILRKKGEAIPENNRKAVQTPVQEARVITSSWVTEQQNKTKNAKQEAREKFNHLLPIKNQESES